MAAHSWGGTQFICAVLSDLRTDFRQPPPDRKPIFSTLTATLVRRFSLAVSSSIKSWAFYLIQETLGTPRSAMTRQPARPTVLWTALIIPAPTGSQQAATP